MAGYSFWPEQGWDGLFQDLADAVTENGGELRLGRAGRAGRRSRTSEVKGVAVGAPAAHPPERDVRGRGRRGRRGDLDAARSGTCSRSSRVGAAGLVRGPDQATSPRTTSGSRGSASTSPSTSRSPMLDRKELATWLHAPLTRTPGFLFEQTAYRPARRAPDGQVPLRRWAAIIPGAKGKRRALPARDVREVRARDRDDVPGPREADLAPPPPRLRARRSA